MKLLKPLALMSALSIFGAVAFAGAVDGPTKQSETVAEGKIDVYRIRFTGGQKATVRAKTQGDDIDLFIYDTHDNLVVKDDEKHLASVCTWTPTETDEYKIKIVNNEKHDVDYKLETN